MKILWLSHLIPFPPQGGGVLQRSANLLKAVAKAHDVTLLAFNQKNILRIYDPDLNVSLPAALMEMNKICRQVKVIDIDCELKSAGKLRLAFRSLFSHLPYAVRWLISDAYENALKDALAQEQYDVIWFDTISLAQYRHYAAMDGKLLMLNHHNVESDMMYRRAEKEHNIFKKVYFYQEAYKLRKYEKNQVSRFNINITCSELDSKRLEVFSPGIATYVIPNGVDTAFFSPDAAADADPHELVFIGGMSWYPNREAMLFFAKHVWPLLKQKIPNIHMHVVGETPPQDIIDFSKHDDHYHVHGFVDNVKDIFNKAGIYVCPISDGGGTKLKILDALAMGKPIVAHPIACEGIDVVDGENVLFAETPEEYAHNIGRLIEDNALRDAFSRSARKLILERYSYDVIGSELLKLLQSTIKR